MITLIEVDHFKIDTANCRSQHVNFACGGLVVFEGLVRNNHEGRQVKGLSYEAYIPMTKKIFEQIIEEARAEFGIKDVVILHRLGDLDLGDCAVWISVGAEHRKEAFLACEYIIDELKRRAPIWKKEHYLSGDSEWVACHCHEEPKAKIHG